MTCLENLYQKVSPGGIVQFDDYGHWAGARKAIDEFFQSHKIRTNLIEVDFSGRRMKKAS